MSSGRRGAFGGVLSPVGPWQRETYSVEQNGSNCQKIPERILLFYREKWFTLYFEHQLRAAGIK